MKKYLFFVVILFSITAFSQNPLKNTTWTAENGLIVHFSTDSITADAGGQIVAIVHYEIKDDVITLIDIGGENACPAEQKGIYNFTLEGTKISFKMKEDDCPGRSQTVDGMVLTKKE